MRNPEENQGEGIARFSPAWDLRPMKESAESWIQEGRALNILIRGPPPALCIQFGADLEVEGGMGAFASLSCEAYLPLCPGGPGVVASGWGGFVLAPPAHPSQWRPWPWPPVLGGAFHLSLGLRLAWPTTVLSPAVRAARM